MASEGKKYSLERAHERFDVELVIRTRGEDVGMTLENLSLGGLFLYSKRYMPKIGSQLVLDLTLPDEKLGAHELEVKGTVVHWIEGNGVGIKFDDDNPKKTMTVLSEYLQRLEKTREKK